MADASPDIADLDFRKRAAFAPPSQMILFDLLPHRGRGLATFIRGQPQSDRLGGVRDRLHVAVVAISADFAAAADQQRAVDVKADGVNSPQSFDPRGFLGRPRLERSSDVLDAVEKFQFGFHRLVPESDSTAIHSRSDYMRIKRKSSYRNNPRKALAGSATARTRASRGAACTCW